MTQIAASVMLFCDYHSDIGCSLLRVLGVLYNILLMGPANEQQLIDDTNSQTNSVIIDRGKPYSRAQQVVVHPAFESANADMQELPSALSALTNLRVLRIKESNIHSLPAFLSNFTRLESVQLTAFEHLQSLPNWLGRLTRLHTLDLQSCTSLTALPECVSLLHSLQRLCMTDCSRLQYLPSDIGQLPDLKTLMLEGCPDVGSQGFLSRSSLTTAWSQSGCPSAWLPASSHQLTSLQLLMLKSCSFLIELGAGLDWMQDLQRLISQLMHSPSKSTRGIGQLHTASASLPGGLCQPSTAACTSGSHPKSESPQCARLHRFAGSSDGAQQTGRFAAA